MLKKISELGGLDRLEKALSMASEPVIKTELRKEFYFENEIIKFKKSLLEINLPIHSLILFGESEKGKSLLMRYWQEVIGNEKSVFIFEPDLISELNDFSFKVNSLDWLFKKYIFLDDVFDERVHSGMTDNGYRNYFSLLEKLRGRKPKPIMIVSTNHINFKMFNPKITTRWKNLLEVNGKIKTKEIK